MMKKLFFLFVLIGLTLAVYAQPVVGSWQGVLNVGMELRIVFHIKDDGKGNFVSTADSPDQSAFGIPCDSTLVSGKEVTILMKDLGASFTGKLVNDTLIEGVFNQGQDFPLSLKKIDKPSVAVRKRPQTPQPPFPYQSEEVAYAGKDKSLQLAATLSIPEGKGPFPTALLITGSGPQNRDEEIMGHKPFEVLADYLCRQGYVVLRADDRGVGKSTGNFALATSADFANDAAAGIDYLLTRPEVNKKKIGLIGHSEGGMIAPMVAAERKDIDFVVLLAGPGVKIVDLMVGQNEALMRSSNVSSEAIAAYLPLYREMISRLISTPDSASAHNAGEILLKKWIAATDDKIVTELKMKDSSSHEAMLSAMAKQITTAWFKYFLAFDPQPYLQKLNVKVLAMNGGKDIQVVAAQNLPGIERALKKSRSKAWEAKELPGLNHLFQTCKKCTVPEYAELEETFSPIALDYIGNWLEKNVK